MARFLPEGLLGSTRCGSVSRGAGAGGGSLVPVGGEAWVARFLPDGLLDMFDPSLPGRPERTLGSGSDLHAGPVSTPPGGGWFAWTPLARSDPWIRTAAAAAEPSGRV
ncbi:MAG: hypothetical protein JO329_24535 [Planctomycetaceae bacterium]|nr:hypothetical protein [Planctomycetaceae bacterium]